MARLAGLGIGFIGLGLMGRPMSVHLMRAGAAMTIFNRSRGVVDELVRFGMRAASSPREVAERSEFVLLMVSDTPAVEAVLRGDDGVIAGLRKGAVVVDMGTTAVAATRALAWQVRAAGGEYVDAPVSGGQLGAEAATLTIMAGGSEESFSRLVPVFETLGRTVTHVGGVGAGQVAKAANQVIVGVTIAAVAEALALGQRAGVDSDRLRSALMGGFAASRVLEVHGARMAQGNFQPGGKVVTHRKDLEQALGLAADLGLDLPTTALVRDLFDRAAARGDGELDHSALYRLYQA
ncbi:MAG: NAD(P)-dependent oxidoreductase [Rhodospirillales bacterium]|nr:NAD(P)-dependent oxidoreductase [Rhodospirillales bacterium]